jgi:HlyD family secretion protein
VQRGEASVAAAESSLAQARVNVQTAQANLVLARDQANRQRELWKQGLTTREALDQAESTLKVRETELDARRTDVANREQMIRQEQAALSTSRFNLSQVTLVAPFDGIVTRRNIEEGENVVVGTMNNAGTVLLTVADMSEIQAEIEVDETDIPNVAIGQRAVVTIDAVPNRMFKGRVTDIGNSPIQAAAQTNAAAGQRQATNFKVVVTIEDPVPDVRPGFTCTAEITTATRKNATAVPIQALTVRELLFDSAGTLIHEPPPPPQRRWFGTPAPAPPQPPAEPGPGQTRDETEGVFIMRDGRAVFQPVKIGIAGERYFEVLSGLDVGDRVITGPFDSVRQIADGSAVQTK